MTICSFHLENSVFVTCNKEVEGTKLKGEINTKLRDLVWFSVAAELDYLVQLTISKQHYCGEIVTNDFTYKTRKRGFL